MNRRAFIRSLAAALPAGALASQVEAETDPVRAAYTILKEAVFSTAPKGYNPHGTIMLTGDMVIAHAFPPNYQRGQMYYAYDRASGDWLPAA